MIARSLRSRSRERIGNGSQRTGRGGARMSLRGAVACQPCALVVAVLATWQEVSTAVRVGDPCGRWAVSNRIDPSAIIDLAHMTSVENWDDEGAPTIPWSEWEAIVRFADRVSESMPGLCAPSFSACGDGTTHARWYNGARWVEVESRDGSFGMTFSLDVDGLRYHDAPSEAAAVRMVVEFLGGEW